MGEPLRADELAPRIGAGQAASLARGIRWLEDEDPRGAELVRRLYREGGGARVIGITGPPGAGKSTLVSAMVARWRRRGLRVAVLAVDPSSPFSGGALLGDRVRMQRHATDHGVFIRSMATRGQLGGLSAAAGDAVALLDAAGFERIVVETVGVGQDELDVVRVAHSTLVVCIPGTGDAVQTLKAGVLEIADCFALNKADLAGADETERTLREMLQLDSAAGWQRPLLRTIASREEGIAALVDALAAHGAYLETSGELLAREESRARYAVVARARRLAQRGALDALERDETSRALVAAVRDRKLDPESAAEALWSSLREA